MWQTVPVEIVGDSHVEAMRVKQGDTESEIGCDMVIKAIGQQKMASFFTDVCGVKTDEKGRVVINEQMQTSTRGYLLAATVKWR